MDLDAIRLVFDLWAFDLPAPPPGPGPAPIPPIPPTAPAEGVPEFDDAWNSALTAIGALLSITLINILLIFLANKFMSAASDMFGGGSGSSMMAAAGAKMAMLAMAGAKAAMAPAGMGAKAAAQAGQATGGLPGKLSAVASKATAGMAAKGGARATLAKGIVGGAKHLGKGMDMYARGTARAGGAILDAAKGAGQQQMGSLWKPGGGTGPAPFAGLDSGGGGGGGTSPGGGGGTSPGGGGGTSPGGGGGTSPGGGGGKGGFVGLKRQLPLRPPSPRGGGRAVRPHHRPPGGGPRPPRGRRP